MQKYGIKVQMWRRLSDGEARGMAFFNKLAAMKPDMRKGHVLLVQLIASGEVDVGLTAYYAIAESFRKRKWQQLWEKLFRGR